MEIWKQTKDYPNYFVSNTGKVRNVKNGRELKQTLHLEQITEEQKQRKMKPIVCIETGIIYKSATDVGTALGIPLSTVTSVARKERKSIRGFHFEYL